MPHLNMKDSLYLQALLNLESRFLRFPSSTDITYEIASDYYGKGSTYDANKPDDSKKWAMKKALDKCDEAIKAFPASLGATNCKYLAISYSPEINNHVDRRRQCS